MSDAKIHFQWTSLAGRGTAESDTISDDRGLFLLNDVQGKRLLVRVSKDGFYSSERQNRLSFEFANPFEEIYYQPASNDPVLFHMRKKNDAERMVKKSIEVMLPGDGTSRSISLESNGFSFVSQLEVQAWKPWPPRPMSPHYDWKVVLKIPGGGFVDAPEEFAFEAPETGYNPEFEINMPASAGDSWKVSAAKSLYFAFGEPRKYGRLNLRTDGNSRYVFIDYVLNPSGSRNLEFDPVKQIESK